VNSAAVETGTARTHWPSLTVGLLIMLVGVLYPPLMANEAGKADHTLAMFLFWAMSAGFVRGLGFIPYKRVWRILFSGWSCALAILLAVLWVLYR
jgi:predicted membrane protein